MCADTGAFRTGVVGPSDDGAWPLRSGAPSFTEPPSCTGVPLCTGASAPCTGVSALRPASSTTSRYPERPLAMELTLFGRIERDRSSTMRSPDALCAIRTCLTTPVPIGARRASRASRAPDKSMTMRSGLVSVMTLWGVRAERSITTRVPSGLAESLTARISTAPAGPTSRIATSNATRPEHGNLMGSKLTHEQVVFQVKLDR